MPAKSAKPRKLAKLQRQLKALVTQGRPAPGLIKPGGRITPRKRVSIYAYAYHARLGESLADDFATVAEVLGEKKFEALAKDYFRRHPSRYASLLDTGQHFVAYLRARKLTALAELARLDWEVLRAFYGPHAPTFDFSALGQVPPDRLNHARLRLHPALGLESFAWPVRDLWVEPHWKRLAGLPRKARRGVKHHYGFFRVDGEVDPEPLSPAQWQVLQAVRKGKTLSQLTRLRLEATPAEWMEWFKTWASLGWFSGITYPA